MNETQTTADGVAREGLFAGASLSSWIALLVLVVVGLYMFADRHVLVLQTDAIKVALGLSDFEVGLVLGLSVAIFAAVLGYPIAWLADRYDTRLVLSASILIWCGAVAALGFAQNFNQLFLFSAIVGIGEAGLIPITYAMIPELFKGRSRLLANSMVIVVGRIGSGLVIVLSGLLVTHIGGVRPSLPPELMTLETWRLALFALALPGPILAAIVLFLRLRADPGQRKPLQRLPAAPVLPFISANKATFGSFYPAIGLFVFGTSALGGFMPVVAMRQMGASPAEVGAGIGTATLVSTVIAMVAVVSSARWMNRRLGKRYPIWMLLLASASAVVIAPLFLFARQPTDIYLLMGISFLFLAAGSMAFPTALQDLTPRLTRARLISITILLNITLSAVAPAAVGAVSDRLAHLENGLMIASIATAMVALAVSSALLIVCARHYLGTVQRALDADAAAGDMP